MTVSADQVAAMRAYLSGNQDEFRRLNRSLDKSKAASRSYQALITATFVEAVEQRFNAQTTRNEVIDYVADLRSRDDEIAEVLDPDRAERMIMTVIADENVDDLSGNERIDLAMLLVAGFVADANFSEAELEAFMEKSRAFADELLG